MNLDSNALLCVQLIGDYFVCMGQIFLLQSIDRKRSCTSVSVKTQLLLAIVFTIRYVDLAVSYIEIYDTYKNELMLILYTLMYNSIKIVHIFISYWTLLIICILIRKKEYKQYDTFRSDVLILSSAVLSLLINYKFECSELMWRFTFYLEAVATVPQAHLAAKAKYTENIVLYYTGLLSLHKITYMGNWIYTYYLGSTLDRIALAAGLVQLILYYDFIANNIARIKSKNNSPGNNPAKNNNKSFKCNSMQSHSTGSKNEKTASITLAAL